MFKLKAENGATKFEILKVNRNKQIKQINFPIDRLYMLKKVIQDHAPKIIFSNCIRLIPFTKK